MMLEDQVVIVTGGGTQEVAAQSIRVNAVAPGFVDTPINTSPV